MYKPRCISFHIVVGTYPVVVSYRALVRPQLNTATRPITMMHDNSNKSGNNYNYALLLPLIIVTVSGDLLLLSEIADAHTMHTCCLFSTSRHCRESDNYECVIFFPRFRVITTSETFEKLLFFETKISFTLCGNRY